MKDWNPSELEFCQAATRKDQSSQMPDSVFKILVMDCGSAGRM